MLCCINIPSNYGASLADLSAALWLDVEYMIVVNPDGTQHRYALEGDEMVALEPIHNPEYAAPADPIETLAADVAYLLQTWSEIGNPPEMVMLQGETLWWQEENIIVPYHTDETIEEVAARMISPRPVLFPNDDPYYDQLYRIHQIESEGIPKLLRELNPPGSPNGFVRIPAPGWWVSSRNSIIRHSGRTLYDLPSSENYEVKEWWDELSTAEQQIEIALAATANARPGSANFDNMRSFEYVMGWIAKNSRTFEQYSGDGMLKELTELLMATEYLYDYGDRDGVQDFGVRYNLVPDEQAWNSVGVSNVHFGTLFDAYYRIQAQLE